MGLLLFLIAVFLFLQKLGGVNRSRDGEECLYLDESLRAFQKVLTTLGFGALLVPVDDRLVRNTVGVVENLENLREGLHDACILVTVHLDGVNELNLCFSVVGEGLDNGCKFLEDLS